MYFNKTLREKARLEVHKKAAYSSEQILIVVPHKSAAIQPLNSHLTNYPSKTKKTG